jgi:hypothetical protein
LLVQRAAKGSRNDVHSLAQHRLPLQLRCFVPFRLSTIEAAANALDQVNCDQVTGGECRSAGWVNSFHCSLAVDLNGDAPPSLMVQQFDLASLNRSSLCINYTLLVFHFLLFFLSSLAPHGKFAIGLALGHRDM